MHNLDAVSAAELAAMRIDYAKASQLSEASVSDGWELLLRNWIADAVAAGVVESNAMVLSTVDGDGHPAARAVLCKAVGEDGIVFFTNYTSDKAHQLAAVPFAAATFTWPVIERSVRLSGPVRKVDPAVTAEYWRGRPRGSQLGAWASAQSHVIAGREELERALARVTEQFAGTEEIPVPPDWGGYLLAPTVVEFWQGQTDRLHNRIRITATDDGWDIVRLQP